MVERHEGGGGTAFGVPSVIGDADREAVTASEATRQAALVEAAWTVFDRRGEGGAGVAPQGPARRRPRHLEDRRATSTRPTPRTPASSGSSTTQRIAEAVLAMRKAVLEVLREPSDGSPVADRKWTPRYAARRIAWHALDHAWEIEDRTEPA